MKIGTERSSSLSGAASRNMVSLSNYCIYIYFHEVERSLGCIHYVCYREGGGGGGGGRGFFFSGSFFYIPPPKVHTNFHNPPPSNQPKDEYPPFLPHKKYQNKYLYNGTLYMCEISRDMSNKNIERALTVYVIPMPAMQSK